MHYKVNCKKEKKKKNSVHVLAEISDSSNIKDKDIMFRLRDFNVCVVSVCVCVCVTGDTPQLNLSVFLICSHLDQLLHFCWSQIISVLKKI